MMWLRKSKKGFTLIELMVVVAIIGVLALLGLRLYTGQQEKAKNAIVKANAGTVQTLIQSELADKSVSDIAGDSAMNTIVSNAGIYNPVTGNQQTASHYATADPGASGTAGDVFVWYDASNLTFYVNGWDAKGTSKVYTNDLSAKK